jgi:hypothetical protein
MYSSKITKVRTETPKSARNLTPEDMLTFLCVMSSASRPPMRAGITYFSFEQTHKLALSVPSSTTSLLYHAKEPA